MPKIPVYDATQDKISPSDLGFTAYETAGRRLGPLYDRAAEAIKEGGVLAAEEIKDSDWPLAFARFRTATTGVSIHFAGGRGGGGGGGRGGLAIPFVPMMSRSAPILSGIAKSAVEKPFDFAAFPEAKEQRQISEAANDWYYGRKDAAGNPITSVKTLSDSNYDRSGNYIEPLAGGGNSSGIFGGLQGADFGQAASDIAQDVSNYGPVGAAVAGAVQSMSDAASSFASEAGQFWDDITTAQ